MGGAGLPPAPLLRSSQKEVINDAVLISSLRRGLKTEVAQWSDTISIPLSWAISGHSSLAGPCTKPYKPLLLLRGLFAVQPLHLHISHSHILLYIKTLKKKTTLESLLTLRIQQIRGSCSIARMGYFK